MNDSRQLAEVVRAACIKAALEAYEEGGVLGLCADGRWEYAISAMRQLDIKDQIINYLEKTSNLGEPDLVYTEPIWRRRET